MRFRHDKYPIPCARVHGAMGASSLSLRASAARFAHQNEQRPAAEFGLFDVGSDPTAVGSTVRITRVVPLGSLPPEPVGAFQAAGGASFCSHRSAPGFAHDTDQPLSLRLLCRQLAEKLQRRGDGRQQDDDVAPLAWINALFGWARSGERRHLTITTGGMLLLALTATLTMGV